jgi:dihydroflavonol-4-reductase
LRYTPVRETFRRTIEWALAEGLVTRRLPGWPAVDTNRS